MTAAQKLPYDQTGSFSKIIIDYVNGHQQLQPFYAHPISIEGIQKAIAERKAFSNKRQLLVDVLQRQYVGVILNEKQAANLQLLKNENCFTITTAHQPNIFTGHLYFIYKILHAVRIAETLKRELPGNDFVPVYYMGSEDADLEELGEVNVNGTAYHWQTKQTGAVGRMKVDNALLEIMDRLKGELSVEAHGPELFELFSKTYTKGTTIEAATFQLVNELFAEYGLIVLLPDNAALKSAMLEIFEDELLNSPSISIVEKTSAALTEHYKEQAHAREINLFYLSEGSRERIERKGAEWTVINTSIKFTREALLAELHAHPERFSPNVILRGLFQEIILPNIAFVGGGGEIAYWLQLKPLFDHYKIPYPVLVLRNSFMIVDEKHFRSAAKLGFGLTDLFSEEEELLNTLVKRETKLQLDLEKEKQELSAYYERLKNISGNIDPTLAAHTGNLGLKALQKIEALEKKMLRAEKRKFDAQQRQLKKLRSALFPNNGLQERVDNFMPYYAKWGNDFIKTLYENSGSLEQQFVIIQKN